MPERIQTPRASSALQAEYDIKGRIALSLDEVVVPVAIVSNLVTTGEDWKKCWTGRVMAAGGVGNFNKMALTNPAGSTGVINVDEVGISCNVGCSYWLEWPNGVLALGLTNAVLFRDSRPMTPALTERPFAICTYVSSAAAVLGTDEMPGHVPSGVQYGGTAVLRPNVAIYPGCSLAIRAGTANVANNIYFLWRERSLLPGEAIT